MPERALPYRPHNHQACVAQALSDAHAICRDENARLTPIRERVLELIWQSHKPLGAYDILAKLSSDGHNAAPPRSTGPWTFCFNMDWFTGLPRSTPSSAVPMPVNIIAVLF